MEVVFGFLLAVAFCVAAAHGLHAGAKALAEKYRSSATAWKAKHPHSMRIARLAGILATAIHGARPAAQAFARDWREHWNLGRDNVRARFPDRYPLPPAAVQPPRPEPGQRTPPAAGTSPSTEPAEPEVVVASPQPEPVAQPTSPPDPQPWIPVVHQGGRTAPPKNGAPVSDLPLVEITNIAAIRAAVTAYAAHQRAEADDAAAAMARAEQELAWVRHLAEGCVVVLDRDPHTATLIASLTEPAQMRLRSATDRVRAADIAAARADAALRGLAEHSHMEEAKDATPQASTQTDVYAGN